ncbi:MAG: SPOR domain-containing protein [Bacteroidetes bacterium SW_9_63_38]|nr:MAG: SPOR domain-containing protein [Bacteroidetes bacterium SW_9_63_38]
MDVCSRLAAVLCGSGLLVLGLSCSGSAPPPRGASATDATPSRVYHVQLDMTTDKTNANQILTEALKWWNRHEASLQPEPIPSPRRAGEAPARISWKAPRYRVRVGPFASQSQAQTVLEAVRSSFPEAFVVPERR